MGIFDSYLLKGRINPALVCPHCQIKGKVHTMIIRQKRGISGAKATGALLTGGLSLLATGLSRKARQPEHTATTAVQPGPFNQEVFR